MDTENASITTAARGTGYPSLCEAESIYRISGAIHFDVMTLQDVTEGLLPAQSQSAACAPSTPVRWA